MVKRTYKESPYIVYEVSKDTYDRITENIILPFCLAKKYLLNNKNNREYLEPILNQNIDPKIPYIRIENRGLIGE